jgi:hypothetical protein
VTGIGDGLKSYSPLELLRIHSGIGDELRRRGLIRSSNNPLGDLAEDLFCRAFQWRLAPASEKAADAVCSDGVRYQIKSRRLTALNGSRQLSAIRNLDARGFDQLAAVLFDDRYVVLKAAIIPWAVVSENSRFQSHTNSSLFFLRDSVWTLSGVVDVTARLKEAASSWSLSA